MNIVEKLNKELEAGNVVAITFEKQDPIILKEATGVKAGFIDDDRFIFIEDVEKSRIIINLDRVVTIITSEA